MPDPQRCLSAPKITPPALPFPFTPTLPKIAISFNPKFCCKLPPLPTPKLPFKIPAVLLNPQITVLKQIASAINGYLDKIQIRCPRE